MKRIFSILLMLTIWCQITYSQISNEDLVKSVYVEIDTSTIAIDSNQVEIFLTTVLKIPNDYEFKKQNIKGTNQTREVDDLGYAHERYEQYYKRIKVEDADIRTHYLNDLLVLANGEYVNAPNIDTVVMLSKEEAIQAAIAYIGATEYIWEEEEDNNWLKSITNDSTASFYPKAELVICLNGFDFEDTLFYVAYKYRYLCERTC